MKTLLLILCAVSAFAADVPLAQALQRAELQCTLTGNGRDALTLTAANPGTEPLTIAIPAGLVCAAAGDRVLVLRTARLTVPPGGSAEARLPTVALSAKNPCTTRTFAPVQDSAPALAPLLRLAAERADLPNDTIQLVALALLEDIAFTPWQEFLVPQRNKEAAEQPHPTPAEVTLAIDALGLLRQLAPERQFALATDPGLKLRALRNPWARAKAVQLYGLDAVPLPPDIGQLLHARPGDNCPICRQRAKMQSPPDL